MLPAQAGRVKETCGQRGVNRTPVEFEVKHKADLARFAGIVKELLVPCRTDNGESPRSAQPAMGLNRSWSRSLHFIWRTSALPGPMESCPVIGFAYPCCYCCLGERRETRMLWCLRELGRNRRSDNRTQAHPGPHRTGHLMTGTTATRSTRSKSTRSKKAASPPVSPETLRVIGQRVPLLDSMDMNLPGTLLGKILRRPILTRACSAFAAGLIVYLFFPSGRAIPVVRG